MLLHGETAIADIGEKLHRSQPTIERSFTKVTGLSMKQTQSMIHLEEIVNYLNQLNTDTWVVQLEGEAKGLITLMGNEVGAIFLQPNCHG